MSFLLVLFPADPTTSTTLLKRTNSHSNSILTKAQSTLSLCLLFLFLTLLLFALSTFEPTPTPTWFLRKPKQNKPNELPLFALQGMGKLHLRGTRAMPDLIVCHVSEDTREDDFKLFFRLLLRSGTLSHSDVVFLFPSSNSLSLKFQPLISQELHSFFKLLEYYYYYKENKTNTSRLLGFDVARFLRKSKAGRDPLWGRKVRVSNHVIMNNNNKKNNSSSSRTNGFHESAGTNSTESTRRSYGSVVSFEVSELDPVNSLAGFLDHVPMSLRRWACYPLLLGRVRRNFKHVALVDVGGLIFTGEPLARGRKLSPESVCVFRMNSEKTQPRARVDPAFLMGGARGIRRLSNSMLTEVVRVATQHKKRNTVSELDVLSQLVGNQHVLKNVALVESAESLPELSSLTGLSSNSDDSSSREFHNNHGSIIRRGNGNIREINSVIMKRICALELDSSVYRDC